MGVPTVYMVGADRLALVPEYLNLGSVVIIAPDVRTLRAWRLDSAEVAPDESGADPSVIVDMAGRRIVHQGSSLPLSDLEFRLLGALLAEPGRAWSFRQLRRHAWEDGAELPTDPYAVKAAIQRLRAKLDVAKAPVAIESVRGYGFRASVEEVFEEEGHDRLVGM